jgi:hypothetical protein
VVGWFVHVNTLLSVMSNQSQRENSLVPKSNGSHRRWAGLTDLRKYLLESGRLGEACSLQIMSSNPGIYSPQDCVTLYRETLAHLQTIFGEADLFQKLVLVKAQLRVNLLENLVQCETPVHVQSELSLFQKDLDSLESIFGIGQISMKTNTFYLRLCLIRINLLPKTYFQDLYSQNMSVIENYPGENQPDITHAYRGAGLAAKALYEETGNEIWSRRLKTLYERKEDIEFRVHGNIVIPLMDHWESIRSSAYDFKTMSEEEVQEILEWYNRYDRKYPDFAIPGIARQVAQLRMRLYAALGNYSEASEQLRELQKWTECLGAASEVEVSFQSCNDVLLGNADVLCLKLS